MFSLRILERNLQKTLWSFSLHLQVLECHVSICVGNGCQKDPMEGRPGFSDAPEIKECIKGLPSAEHSIYQSHQSFREGKVLKIKVTRILSTRKKSIKIQHLTWAWYLQCFVCIIIQGPELQKDAKHVFHPEQSSPSCYVSRQTGICIPTSGD